LLFAFSLATAANAAAFAQEATPIPVSDDQVNAIARQLYCPVCENVPLDVCGTQACQDWREEIRAKLAEGWTEAQIEQYFSARFGDRVLATPPARGLNWLIYLVPPLAFVAGVYILFRGIQSWKKGTAEFEDEVEVPESDAAYVARLEEELRKR